MSTSEVSVGRGSSDTKNATRTGIEGTCDGFSKNGVGRSVGKVSVSEGISEYEARILISNQGAFYPEAEAVDRFLRRLSA